MDLKQPLIIFLDSVRMQAASNETNIKSWDFPKELVSDGKILNRGEFTAQLIKYFSTNHVGTNNVILLISESMCYTHTVKAEETTEKEQHARNFYDMVPLETAIKHEYEIGRDILLVAVDAEFVKTVADALMNHGSAIGPTVPAVVLPEVGTKRWLDGAYVTYIIKNAPALERWSMFKPDQTQIHEESPEKEIAPNKKGPPYALIGVFVVLIIILIVMVIFM